MAGKRRCVLFCLTLFGVCRPGPSRAMEAAPLHPDESLPSREAAEVEAPSPEDADAQGRCEIVCRCCAEAVEPAPSVDDAEVSPPNPVIALQDELFLGVALITAWGVHFWDWFERSFHLEVEHGFSSRSSTGGADKTGHFFVSYTISDFLAWRLAEKGHSTLSASLLGALAGMFLMTWIEVGDATSDYGWSMEDLLADFLGAAVSLGRNTIPHAEELVDFRVQYWPTRQYLDSGEIVADYSGMRFLLAVKVAGMGVLGRTPLRFLELHAGYYSRGFRSFDENEEDAGRYLYWGVGLSLNELLRPILPDVIKKPVETVFTYYQPPLTTMEAQAHEL